MNFLKKMAMFSLLAVFAIVINACSADPSKDIDNLKQKFSAINADEAQGYVPELFGTIQGNIVTMDQDMAALKTKSGLFTDYSKVKELLTKTNADLVQLDAQMVSAKANMKAEVEQLLPGLDTMLTEADGYITDAGKTKALKAKVPALKTELEALKASVEQVKSDAAAEKYYAAKAQALSIQQKYDEMKGTLTASN